MKRKFELNRIDPTIYGLSVRTNLVKIDEHLTAIVIDRKSRILMKDFDKIKHISKNIQQRDEQKKIVVATSAPMCSKTLSALKEENISVIDLSEI